MNKESAISAKKDEYLQTEQDQPSTLEVNLTEVERALNEWRVLMELENNPGGGD